MEWASHKLVIVQVIIIDRVTNSVCRDFLVQNMSLCIIGFSVFIVKMGQI